MDVGYSQPPVPLFSNTYQSWLRGNMPPDESHAAPLTPNGVPAVHQLVHEREKATGTLQPTLAAVSERDIVSCLVQMQPTRARRIN